MLQKNHSGVATRTPSPAWASLPWATNTSTQHTLTAPLLLDRYLLDIGTVVYLIDTNGQRILVPASGDAYQIGPSHTEASNDY